MSEVKNSDYNTYDFKETPKYKPQLEYVLATPKSGSAGSITAGYDGDTYFDIPNRGINWFKSYINITRAATAGFTAAIHAASDATYKYGQLYENIKTPSLITKMKYKPDKDGPTTIEIADVPAINNQTLPYETPFEEFKKKTPHNYYMYPTKTDQQLDNVLITVGNATTSTVDTNSSYSVNDFDPQYYNSIVILNNSTAAISASTPAFSDSSVRYYLRDIPRGSFFSVNKLIPPSPQGAGLLTITFGHPEYFIHACVGDDLKIADDPTQGTKVSYNGTVTLTNVELWLACEGNELVEAKLKTERDTIGVSLFIPYPVHHTDIMSDRINHRVTCNIEPSYGTYIRKIYASPASASNNLPAASFRYDYNNLYNAYDFYQSDTTSTVTSKFSKAITPITIQSYFTKINGKRQQQGDLSIAKLDDYTQSEQTLEGSVITNPIIFYQNWAIIQDFTRGDNSSDITPKGRQLDKSTLQWEIDATAKSTMPLNWEFTAVYGRELTINRMGVSLV